MHFNLQLPGQLSAKHMHVRRAVHLSQLQPQLRYLPVSQALVASKLPPSSLVRLVLKITKVGLLLETGISPAGFVQLCATLSIDAW